MVDAVFEQSANQLRNLVTSLRNENQTLKARLLKLEKSLATERKNQEGFVVIGEKPVPIKIVRWMDEYLLPWECFWCYEHDEWVVELDAMTPYHMEQHLCSKCATE